MYTFQYTWEFFNEVMIGELLWISNKNIYLQVSIKSAKFYFRLIYSFQFQLMELFNLVIIVHVREVLLLEILLELLPHDLSIIDLLHFPEVFPPYRCSSIQIEYGYPCLHISIVILDLEIFIHPKNPSFSFFTSLYLTIKGRRSFLLKFILWTIYVMYFLLSSVRWVSQYPLQSGTTIQRLRLIAHWR